MKEEKDVICFRGERDLWIDFVAQLKKQRKEVWNVLEPFIQKYLKEK